MLTVPVTLSPSALNVNVQGANATSLACHVPVMPVKSGCEVHAGLDTSPLSVCATVGGAVSAAETKKRFAVKLDAPDAP